MSTWTDHAHRELSRAGHRAGGAREEVLALLAGQNCCLSAQDIHDQLRDGGKTIRLSLRKGMKWSDGAPFNADNWVFWY